MGVFGGNNKVLTVNYSGSEDYIAPFRAINEAKFYNLEIRGSINSAGSHAAGLVGHLRGTVYIYGCTSNVDITCAGGAGGFVGLCDEDYLGITDCLSSTVIHSPGGSNSGFVGWSQSRSRISFAGCVFNGKILQHNGSGGSNGGFLGWKEDDKTVEFWDCLYDPATLSDSETYASDGSATFSREHADHAATITNSYYTTAFGTPQGNQAHSITAGENVTIDIEHVGDYTHCNLIALATEMAIKYNNVIYSSNGNQVDYLRLSNTPPAGCTFNGYTVSPEGTTLIYDGSYYYTLLSMPDTDVIINATYDNALAITGYGDSNDKWVFIASPVMGSIAPTAVGNLIGSQIQTEPTVLYDYDLYRFNQSAEFEWQNYHKHTDDFNLVNGQGYLYATKENRTLVFVGEYNNTESVDVQLIYNGSAHFAGYNLMGNPFLVNAYILDKRPFYIMNSQGSEIIAAAGVRNYIKPMEGIFVHAAENGETMTFTTVEPDGNPSPELVINVNQTVTNRGGTTTAVIDRAIVRFDEGQTLPKFQIRENSTKIYIPQGAEDYAIAYSDGHGEMPVNFKAKENGEYTITVNPEGVELGYLHLIDNMTGADVDLLSAGDCGSSPAMTAEGRSYTFTAKTTDYESRFKLVFVSSTAFEGENGNDSFAFYTNGNWIIANEGQATLQVIDLNGRILSSETVNGSVSKGINQPAGVYMIRLINGDNVKVQKIVVR